MRISILGCGWYGLALAKTLVGKGFVIKGSTTSEKKLPLLKAAGIIPFLVDLTVDSMRYNTEFFNCDVLVIAIPPKTRSGMGEEYVPKLKHVVNAVINHQVKKVVLVSSTGVYADLNKEVNESTSPQPDTPGDKVLLQAEELFKQQTEFKTAIIRFGGLVGPGRDPGRFFAGKKDVPNGLAPVNMLHLDDCIGVTEAILAKDAFGYIFNACTPHHPFKHLFYTQAAQRSGLPAPEFLHELKEWKIVNGSNVKALLNYQYKVNNWFDWLKQEML
jgi:nucleoside-diphosphate-sugar epimerase